MLGLLYVTSSVKTCLIEEQTVSSQISYFHTLVLAFMVNTAHGATNVFAIAVHERQKVQALIKRRAGRAASDQDLVYLKSLIQNGYGADVPAAEVYTSVGGERSTRQHAAHAVVVPPIVIVPVD